MRYWRSPVHISKSTYLFSSKIDQKHPEFVKQTQILQHRPLASEHIRTHPYASKQVRMDPYGSKHVRKLQKTYENFEKSAKPLKQITERDISRDLPLPVKGALSIRASLQDAAFAYQHSLFGPHILIDGTKHPYS